MVLRLVANCFRILRNVDDVAFEPPLPPLQAIHAHGCAGSGDKHLLHLREARELGRNISRVRVVVVGERLRLLVISLAAVTAGRE